MEVRQLCWEDAKEGDAVTPVRLHISYSRVVMNAGTSRDYMRGHHDPEYARTQGVKTIYMNSLFHFAFVDRLMTDWAGPQSFIARRKIVMRGSICAGDTIIGQGRVLRVGHEEPKRHFVDLSMTVRNERELCCLAEGTLLLPLRANRWQAA